MALTGNDRDDVAHALTQVLAFYGKSIDEVSLKLWMRALADYPPDDIRQALADYPGVGKYAPKPLDIKELIEDLRQQRRQEREALPPAPEPESQCPPEVGAAWAWFIGLVASDGCNEQLAGAMPRREISLEQQERYLHIVNHEAWQQGSPESIPDKYKLEEVWGRVA